MGRSTIRINYQPLILTSAGEKPTVPTDINALPGDVGWRTTDLVLGQHAYNVVDDMYYIRALSGIESLAKSLTKTHDQGVPAEVWNVHHGLGKYPSVIVKDSAGTTVEGQIELIDKDNIKLTFSAAFAGTAYCS